MLCFGLEIVRKLALVEWKIGPRGGPTWAPGAFRRALVRHVGRRGRWEAKFGQLWGRSWALLAALGAVLGPSWAALGASWAASGGHVAPPGAPFSSFWQVVFQHPCKNAKPTKNAYLTAF